MTLVLDLQARRILDSRGNPTVEVDVFTESGFGRAAAPSGASTGKHEVKAWPEGGVPAALRAARDAVFPELVGMDSMDQRGVDEELARVDGSPDFRVIGGNLAVAVSLAVAKAAADDVGIPLFRHLGGAFQRGVATRPLGNVLGGGAHAIGGTSIQEFMAVARGPDVRSSVFANAAAHKAVGQLLKQKLPNAAIGKGDEGAWVAPVEDEEAMAVVASACDEVASVAGFDIGLALDVAATELWTGKAYKYRTQQRSPKQQLDFMAGLAEQYGLVSVEDPFHEEAFDAFAELTDRIGQDTLVVGDDLLVTNPERLQRAITEDAGNTILIKVNQIGTLTRTVDTIDMAHRAGWKCIVSHRSGETTDETIAHLAVAFDCLGLKTGAVGGERLAKLNELMRIEEMLGGPEPEPSPEVAARGRVGKAGRARKAKGGGNRKAAKR